MIRFLLVFLPLVVGGDRLGAWLCGRLVARSQDRFVTLYEGRSKADILILGNSRADNHFPQTTMSQKLGLRVVNLGLGGVSGVVAETLLRDYVERNPPPKILILEPSCLVVSTAIGDMRLFAPYSARLKALLRTTMPEFHVAAQAFHLFHYNNEMFFRVLHAIGRSQEDRLPTGSIGPDLLRVLKGRGSYNLINPPENEEAFSRLLRYARELGIAVRIVITPYLPDQFLKIQNYAAWVARLRELGVQDGELKDYGNRFDRREWFMDGYHMNAEGARQLFELMRNEGVFNP